LWHDKAEGGRWRAEGGGMIADFGLGNAD
jgi:hypothetical protein